MKRNEKTQPIRRNHTWQKSPDGYWYILTSEGKLRVQHNPKSHLWVWDAIQEQRKLIVPDTHRATGRAHSLSAAKRAAFRALEKLIDQNAP